MIFSIDERWLSTTMMPVSTPTQHAIINYAVFVNFVEKKETQWSFAQFVNRVYILAIVAQQTQKQILTTSNTCAPHAS